MYPYALWETFIEIHLCEKMRTRSKKGLYMFLDTHFNILDEFTNKQYLVTTGAKRNSEFHPLHQYLVYAHVSLSFEREMECI